MQNYAHVITEYKHGVWNAWFGHEPEQTCVGSDCAYAVAILIDQYGPPQLQWERIVAIDEEIRDGHAEFLVPYSRSVMHVTAVSMN